MKTILARRVKNTTLPKSHALLPLLEAVVNGIQAIDARYGADTARGELKVVINRSPQAQPPLLESGQGRPPLRDIVGFSVHDNGIGFTIDNMNSFTTLDSDYKAELGCRGVGRLLWLKAFDRVEVSSVYEDDGESLQCRSFTFTVEREVEYGMVDDSRSDVGTIVSLIGFKEDFRRAAAKSVEAIARQVFEHCIWYFLREGGAPNIIIMDDEVTFSLRDILDDEGYSQLIRQELTIKGKGFSLLGIPLRSSTRSSAPRLCWCAANRVVREENIAGKVPGLYGRLKDGDGNEFTYVCYLSSPYLDDHVRSDRTEFDLVEQSDGDTLIDELSLGEIRKSVLEEIAQNLAEPLAASCSAARERVHEYITSKAPKYRPLIRQIESAAIAVDPSMRDQDLELLLHRISRDMEVKVLAEGQAVFAESSGERVEGYDERLQNYLKTVTELNQSDLANYVSRRRTTLDILEKLIQSDSDGRYAREESIHSLLFPMRKESADVSADASNLWILDERLVFHDYLASDLPFSKMSVMDGGDLQRPDIFSTRTVGPDSPILAAEGHKPPFQSIVVVELKRPMRDDTGDSNNPILQCLRYVRQVRKGCVKTASGRPVPANDQSPAFCYIVADLTPPLIDLCQDFNLTVTHDGMGYFGYNESHKAYVEVISFDRLLNGAMERNRAFFDKLGLPSS